MIEHFKPAGGFMAIQLKAGLACSEKDLSVAARPGVNRVLTKQWGTEIIVALLQGSHDVADCLPL